MVGVEFSDSSGQCWRIVAWVGRSPRYCVLRNLLTGLEGSYQAQAVRDLLSGRVMCF